MFLGYEKDHAKDAFCFLNMEANRVILRDIIWLNIFFSPEITNTDEGNKKIILQINQDMF